MLTFGEYQTEKANFYFRILTEDDLAKAQQLVLTHYSTKEQLRVSLNVPRNQLNAIDSYRVKSYIKQNASVGAFESKTGRLVGVQMNKLVMQADGNETDKEMKQLDAKYPWRSPIRRLMTKLYRVDLFQFFETDRLFWMHMLTVHDEFTRLGLGQQLVINSEKLAKYIGYSITVTKPTSAYSTKLVKNLNYSFTFSLDVQEYVDDVTGENPFRAMTYPHNILSLCHRRLLD
ncbi:uncharacterized protein LOC144747591 [Ciona intestinalis]